MKNVILTTLLFSSSLLLADSYGDIKKLAMLAYKSGDKAGAISMVKHYVENNPQSYKAQNLSAVFYYWSGEHQKAKDILEKLVAKNDYEEARKLLKIVNKKMGTSTKVAKTRSYKAVRSANKKTDKTDLEYLVAQIQENPQDIQNRILLSKFYFKIEEYQKSYDLAHEVLAIDPHNKKMKTITQHLENHYKLSYSAEIEGSAVDKDKAKFVLKKLHTEKKYNAYMNLYETLSNAGVSFTQEEYIDILHASIMMEKYQAAEEIIAKGLLPVSKKTLKVQLLLSKKLARTVASK